MICFRDMSFCSDAPLCANREKCDRHFSDEQERGARMWWGSEGAPVAFMSMKNECDMFLEVKE
jgi:hypothetical protein